LEEVSRPRERKSAGDELTAREMDVLRLVTAGLRDQAIADRLAVSARTVRTHVSHILAKLHLTSRTQAALYAVREGLAEPHDARADGE
jgi:DNA-binding NarL/FixJ family response regulator